MIVRVALPDALDRLRRRCVRDAVLGVPAHVTLSYPFVEPAALDADVRRTIASIASAHLSFSFALSGPELWPDTVYAAVTPDRPFLALHRDLALAFPGFPIYGRPGFELIPHVTIADRDDVHDPSVLDHLSWADLPADRTADALEVIAEGRDGWWRTMWTAPLRVPDAIAGL